LIRIAYLIVDLEIGGTERVLERLVTRLDRGAFTPLVISLTSTGPIGPRIARTGTPVLALESRGAFDGRAGRWLVATLRRFRPDILHAFLFHANLVSRWAALLSRRPAVVATHRTLEDSGVRWALERLTWRWCDRILCVSEAARRHLQRTAGVPAGRIAVIRNGTPLGNEARPGPWVATACRVDRRKGVEDVLTALRGLAPIRVIGDGPDRRALQQEANGAEFTGMVDDVGEHLDGASVFVHASRLGEGLPNAVLEAMAAGLPVVATDVGGTREALVPGVTGFLVPPGDLEALRERVGELLRDRDRAREMGRLGRERIRREFSMERMMGEYEGLYRLLLKEGARFV